MISDQKVLRHRNVFQAQSPTTGRTKNKRNPSSITITPLRTCSGSKSATTTHKMPLSKTRGCSVSLRHINIPSYKDLPDKEFESLTVSDTIPAHQQEKLQKLVNLIRESPRKQTTEIYKEAETSRDNSETPLPSTYPTRSTRTSPTIIPRSASHQTNCRTKSTPKKSTKKSLSYNEKTPTNEDTPTSRSKCCTLSLRKVDIPNYQLIFDIELDASSEKSRDPEANRSPPVTTRKTPTNENTDPLKRSPSPRSRNKATPNYQLIYEQELDTASEQSYDSRNDLLRIVKSPRRTARKHTSSVRSAIAKSPNKKAYTNLIALDSADETSSVTSDDFGPRTSAAEKLFTSPRKRGVISYQERKYSDSSSECSYTPRVNGLSYQARVKRTNFIRSTSIDSSVVAGPSDAKGTKLTVAESDTDDLMSECSYATCQNENDKETLLSSEGSSDTDLGGLSSKSSVISCSPVSARSTRSKKRPRVSVSPTTSNNTKSPARTDKYELLKRKFKIRECFVKLKR